MSKSQLVWGRVTEGEKDLVRKVSNALGMSVSDYIRFLILKDLEARSILTTKVQKIKDEIRGSTLNGGAEND